MPPAARPHSPPPGGSPARRAADGVLPPPPGLRGRIDRALFGQSKQVRIRMSQCLLAFGLLCLVALVQQGEVMLGLVDARQACPLTAFTLGTSFLCCVLVRCGQGRRLASHDPSLSMLQSVLAVTALGWAYAITGPARGALLGLLAPLFLLGGMFQLRAGQTRVLMAYWLVLVTGVMLWRTSGDSPRYDPRVEAIHWAFSLIVVTAVAALAIRIGRLRSRLARQKATLTEALELSRRLAEHDALTGLLNRRAMGDLLTLHWTVGAAVQPQDGRPGEPATAPMAMAMMDIDHFKQVNDTHGHAVGDAVLQRFAEIAQAGVRGRDVLSRWGGEEFLLLMPGTGQSGAMRVLERLRGQMERGGFETLAPGLAVTFSAGVAERVPGEPHAATVERADKALYRAKHNGRNRFEAG
ncbi:GGDEF domain-containing protein [Acidovorax sp. NCPPB 3576]|uniref:GGDEF domain-containing protein n=1 Tax=Acidovorax sp. NCPPB 3576 TaxID=2940488 RepID=UPI00234972D2|nr:diguanylate cyclase [Acidovorax sp. NCPPB 3576]WCM86535.1 diguanylate cyclase [Acidovorax sp. NCPPB 3576]